MLEALDVRVSWDVEAASQAESDPRLEAMTRWGTLHGKQLWRERDQVPTGGRTAGTVPRQRAALEPEPGILASGDQADTPPERETSGRTMCDFVLCGRKRCRRGFLEVIFGRDRGDK